MRDKYLVVQIDDDTAQVQKFVNNQFRSRKYKVKLSDIMIIPSSPNGQTKSDCDDRARIENADLYHKNEEVPPKPLSKRCLKNSYDTEYPSTNPSKRCLKNSHDTEHPSTNPSIPSHVAESSSDESESESEDEIIDIPSISKAVRNHLDTDHHTLSPLRQPTHPTRQRRVPAWHKDYTQYAGESSEEDEPSQDETSHFNEFFDDQEAEDDQEVNSGSEGDIDTSTPEEGTMINTDIISSDDALQADNPEVEELFIVVDDPEDAAIEKIGTNDEESDQASTSSEDKTEVNKTPDAPPTTVRGNSKKMSKKASKKKKHSKVKQKRYSPVQVDW